MKRGKKEMEEKKRGSKKREGHLQLINFKREGPPCFKIIPDYGRSMALL